MAGGTSGRKTALVFFPALDDGSCGLPGTPPCESGTSGLWPLLLVLGVWAAWGWFAARPAAKDMERRGQDAGSWFWVVFLTGFLGLYLWERARQRHPLPVEVASRPDGG